MNIQILAEKNAKALQRISEAAPAVAERLNIPSDLLDRLTATSKDRAVEAMQRVEAVADLMEYLVQIFIPGKLNEQVSVPYVLDLPVKDVLSAVAAEEHLDVLADMLQREQAGKVRKGVVAALEKRIAEVTHIEQSKPEA